ncbi:hypothetical protein COCON_G00149040 [Conger conger]|uniref:Immunoglobulin domain-containing protein n=1 Tax=Conger conger TaxID=82655 RepID=A0A9Q1HWD0_CONCO|nr:hypothetical protein COCON_G00149040 [Conger conger]
MRYPLQILSLLAIHWTAMGDVLGAHGTEGVDLYIKCPYPDGYLHLPKYVCRHPCGRWDVLITSAVSERAGRFLLNDNSHGRFFSLTIIKLSLQDAGLYYCGIETWGRDWMVKVKVTVSKATVPAATLPPSAVQSGGGSPHSSSVRPTGTAFSAEQEWRVPFSTPPYYSRETATVPLTLDGNNDYSMETATVPLTLDGNNADLSVSVDNVQDEEDPEHVYDEYTDTVVYSTIGLPQEDSEQAYCTVQFSDLPSNENDLYSLVMSH